ncbi:SUKH-4 family immunity protein [Rufibacter aurantiacus]|uniref:SUKH-4 family immunity protein n=1 Tax=Rufibacter aurantiacus TaxID=2817374 RepID=UPI001B306CFA|nr:SUKH-4 family immunity protein [Rufibacter aurantiacus]
MKDQLFLDAWATISKEIICKDIGMASKFNFGPAAVGFLFKLGLPSDIENLVFLPKEGELRTLNQEEEMDDPEFDKYFAFGFLTNIGVDSDSGNDFFAQSFNPVVLNLQNQELLFLVADDGYSSGFINSNLERFAKSVIKFEEFKKGLKNFDANSLEKTEFSDEQFDSLIEDLQAIDPKVFTNGYNAWLPECNYWHYVLSALIWKRDNEREFTVE